MADLHISTDKLDIAQLFVAYQLTRDMANSSAKPFSPEEMRAEFVKNLEIFRKQEPPTRIANNLPASRGSRSVR